MAVPLTILTDYRGFFYSSTRHKDVGMDVPALVAALAARGIEADVRPAAGLDLRRENFAGRLVIAQSSEDRHLHYKSFLEDLLLALQLQGATLVPRFELYRAHHDKVFMELLRDVLPAPALKAPRGRVFGTYEDFLRAGWSEYPAVFKPSAGFQAHGVRLARDEREGRRAARAVGRTAHFVDDLKDVVKRWVRPWHVARSRRRGKFVVQPFLPGLAGDWKLLVYGEKVFALRRGNRPGDFRASGSGRFSFVEDVPRPLLDAARAAFEALDTPFLSLDMALSPEGAADESAPAGEARGEASRAGEARGEASRVGGVAQVFEFQCVCFGTYTLENAPFWFEREGGEWVVRRGRAQLEDEVAAALAAYLARHGFLPPNEAPAQRCP